MAMPFQPVVVSGAGPDSAVGVPVAVLWLLRLVVRGALGNRILRDDDVREALQLPEAGEGGDSDPPGTGNTLKERLAKAEDRGATDDGPLLRNVAALGRVCQLTDIECAIVALAATMENDPALRECFLSPNMQPREVHRLIGVALNVPKRDIAHALRPDGPLRATRLLEIEVGSRRESPIRLLSGFADVLVREHRGTDALVSLFVRRAARTDLSIDDFAYMPETVDLAVGVLRGALRSRSRGVNLLFYGAPGTGKTEFARALAAQVGARLYEVNDEDRDGDTLGGSARLGACALAQRMLSRTRRSLLLFDEAEDVFPHEMYAFFGVHQRSTDRKSWTHRLLEQAPVPVIWICNRAEQIDPATLRRFLVAVELRTPPKSVRTKMIQRRLARVAVGVDWAERVAADDRFTPADADKVARVARLLRRRDAHKLEPALSLVVDASLALAGLARSSAPAAGPTPYSLRFLNVETIMRKRGVSIAPSAIA